MYSGTAPIPFLPLWEACQAFTAHLSYVRFKNGEGVLFLTQWDTETSAVTNAGLEYAFQGLTDDGLYSVYAEFAVKSPTLPFGDEPEVVQWNMKNYLLLHRSKKYQDYVHPFVNSLEQTQPDKFQPSLRLLQELVESLEVKPD